MTGGGDNPCKDPAALKQRGTVADTRCTLACKAGYIPKGMPLLSCSPAAAAASTAFQCDEMACEKIEFGDGVTGSGVADTCAAGMVLKPITKSTCTLACKAGYVPRGDTRRVCGSDAAWSGTEAQCVPVSCRMAMAPALGQCGQQRAHR